MEGDMGNMIWRKKSNRDGWIHIFHIIVCALIYVLLYILISIVVSHFFSSISFFPRRWGKTAPSWVTPTVIWAPAILTIFLCRKWLAAALSALKERLIDMAFDRLNIDSDKPFRIPRTKWMQKQVWDMLIDDANSYTELASGGTYIAHFVSYYDRVIEDLQMLCQLEKIKEDNFYPQSELMRLKEEFQPRLCDRIIQEKERLRQDIKGRYKDDPVNRERLVRTFESNLRDLSDRYIPRTAVLADDAVQELKKAAGMYTELAGYVEAEKQGIAAVDHMEGHDFEYWCAALLEKCGYTNVEVTKGSGDQGVDVVATKDEIRYAVQCKCYSSKLGNKPVQEVFAGKQMYGCQIGVVMTNNTFTQGAVELAETTGVLLWDREKLESMLAGQKV